MSVLKAEDYKEIIGLIEGIPKDGNTLHIKNGYYLIASLLDCAIDKIHLPEKLNSYTKLQIAVEEKNLKPRFKTKWDDLANDYTVIPELPLEYIKDNSYQLVLQYSNNSKEIKLLHNFLKTKGIDLLEEIQISYINFIGLNKKIPTQHNMLGVIVSCLNNKTIKIEKSKLKLYEYFLEENCNHGNKYTAKQTLSLLTHALIHQRTTAPIFQYKWLIQQTNNFFDTQKTINKNSIISLQNFLKEINNHDLSAYKMSPYFNKYYNSEPSIKEKSTQAFHWQIDTLQFAKENSISVVTLCKNMDIITNIILNNENKPSGIININKFSEKKIISLVVVYDELNSVENIKNFLNYAISITKQGVLLNKEDLIKKWHNIGFHESLNIELQDDKNITKKKKL